MYGRVMYGQVTTDVFNAVNVILRCMGSTPRAGPVAATHPAPIADRAHPPPSPLALPPPPPAPLVAAPLAICDYALPEFDLETELTAEISETAAAAEIATPLKRQYSIISFGSLSSSKELNPRRQACVLERLGQRFDFVDC